MKTNAQEREAIANKLYKEMKDYALVKTAEAKKNCKTFKSIMKIEGECQALADKQKALWSKRELAIAKANKSLGSTFVNLEFGGSYSNGSYESMLHYAIADKWSCMPDIKDAIILSQMQSEDFDGLMESLRKLFIK
jgi:hypothetical protein